MAYKVVYDPDEDCVFGSITGDVDLEMVQRYAREIIKQLSAHNCLRFLNDMREASLQMSTVDLYDLPAWIEEAGVDPSCRRALLVSRDFNDYEFYETVSRNHGHIVAVFTDASKTGIFHDTAKACEWLGPPTTPSASDQERRAPAPSDAGRNSV